MTHKCLWKAEIVDDSLKELFIAETLYCDAGQQARAAFRLAIQAGTRIPAIQKQAGQTKHINPPELVADIQKIIDKMNAQAPCDEVKKAIRETDVKWAKMGYKEFAACTNVKK